MNFHVKTKNSSFCAKIEHIEEGTRVRAIFSYESSEDFPIFRVEEFSGLKVALDCLDITGTGDGNPILIYGDDEQPTEELHEAARILSVACPKETFVVFGG